MATAIKSAPCEVTVYDHPCVKVMAAVPLFGLITNFVLEHALVESIKTAHSQKNWERVIELIEIKNEYKMTSIVREVIMLALLVAGMALAILAGGPLSTVITMFCLMGIIVMACLITLHHYEITHNTRVLEWLKREEGKLFSYEVM